jgi:protein-tyrosine phosphatase
MVVQPFWINRGLAIVPRPRGGDWLDDEMHALREAGIDVVVSTLEEFEAMELGLEREQQGATNAGLRLVAFPIQDRGVPRDLKQFSELLSDLEQCIANGKRVGIHCRACIGRSSVVAASLLIRSGTLAEQAWSQIEVARGSPVPDTPEQLEWVDRHMRPKA